MMTLHQCRQTFCWREGDASWVTGAILGVRKQLVASLNCRISATYSKDRISTVDILSQQNFYVAQKLLIADMPVNGSFYACRSCSCFTQCE